MIVKVRESDVRWMPFFLSLAACAQTDSGPIDRDCGESFCLGKEARIVSKSSPVEDFNLYSIDFRSYKLSIYEGNNPSSLKAQGRAIQIHGKSAHVISEGSKAIIRITWDSGPWPRFLEITSKSKTAERDALDLALITTKK